MSGNGANGGEQGDPPERGSSAPPPAERTAGTGTLVGIGLAPPTLPPVTVEASQGELEHVLDVEPPPLPPDLGIPDVSLDDLRSPVPLEPAVSSPAVPQTDPPGSESALPAGPSPSAAARPRRRRDHPAVPILVIGVLAGAAYLTFRRPSSRTPVAPATPTSNAVRAKPTATPAATAIPSIPTTPSPGVASAAPPPPSMVAAAPTSPSAGTAATAKPEVARDMTLLDTSDAQAGHRIFVDELTVGQTPQAVLVKCGRHAVRIGSAGRTRQLDLPCGKHAKSSEL